MLFIETPIFTKLVQERLSQAAADSGKFDGRVAAAANGEALG